MVAAARRNEKGIVEVSRWIYTPNSEGNGYGGVTLPSNADLDAWAAEKEKSSFARDKIEAAALRELMEMERQMNEEEQAKGDGTDGGLREEPRAVVEARNDGGRLEPEEQAVIGGEPGALTPTAPGEQFGGQVTPIGEQANGSFRDEDEEAARMGMMDSYLAEQDGQRDVTVEALRAFVRETEEQQRRDSFAERFSNFVGKAREQTKKGVEMAGKWWERARAAAVARLSGVREKVRARIEESRAKGKERRRVKIEGNIAALQAKMGELKTKEGELRAELARIDEKGKEKRKQGEKKMSLVSRLRALLGQPKMAAAA